MEAWRQVFRDGVVKTLGDNHLGAMLKALQEDSPTLLQGATTSPPPLMCVSGWKCEGACLIGLAGWQGDSLNTVGDVEEFFAETCFRIDQELGEPAAVRHFLNWFDDTPRSVMRRELLFEVRRELDARKATLDESELIIASRESWEAAERLSGDVA